MNALRPSLAAAAAALLGLTTAPPVANARTQVICPTGAPAMNLGVAANNPYGYQPTYTLKVGTPITPIQSSICAPGYTMVGSVADGDLAGYNCVAGPTYLLAAGSSCTGVLPPGLNVAFSGGHCVISGTPTTASAAQVYSVTARDPGCGALIPFTGKMHVTVVN